MDYRRRYQRRFQNQNHGTANEEKVNVVKHEEKIVQETTGDEKSNVRNVYLQRLLVKNNSPTSSNNILSSVNESLPSFTNNIRDILSTEENKKKAIKFVIQKRSGDQFGSWSPRAGENEEESNPVLSSKYYRNTRNINNNLNQNQNQSQNQNSRFQDTSSNKQNAEPRYENHYYFRRNRNYATSNQDNNNNINQNQVNNNEINNRFGNNYNLRNNNINNINSNTNNNNTTFVRRKFIFSSSATNIANNQNINNNNNEEKDANNNINNNSLYRRKNDRNYYNTSNVNNNLSTEKKEVNVNTDKIETTSKPRYKYYRGFNYRKNENENNEPKEEKKPEEKAVHSIPLNLKAGYNYSYGRGDNSNFGKNDKKDLDNKNKANEFLPPPQPIRNYTYMRQRYKTGGDTEEKAYSSRYRKNDFVKTSPVEITILSNNAMPTTSRYKRKYGRFAANNENVNANENLSFKDENDLVNYINRKYKQDKILELFNIKNDENERKKKELNDLRDKLDEEIQKNKENEMKLKKLEKNIEDQNKEINNKSKDIDNQKKKLKI